MRTFILSESGARSGLKIRPIRVVTGIQELRAALKARWNWNPDDQSLNNALPYKARVYEVFSEKSPKKMTDTRLRELYVGDTVKQAGGVDASRIVNTYRPISYADLKSFRDGAVVWVLYSEGDEVLVDHPYKIKRSYTMSTKERPVWKLVGYSDPRFEEVFVQREDKLNDKAFAQDADGMTLFFASSQ